MKYIFELQTITTTFIVWRCVVVRGCAYKILNKQKTKLHVNV